MAKSVLDKVNGKKRVEAKDKKSSAPVSLSRERPPQKYFKENSFKAPDRIEPKKEEKPQKPFIDNYDLPANYNTTNLTLIARDPQWIYAYWEITHASIEALKNQIGYEADRAVYALRMYDVTCVDFNGRNAHRTFDIDVGPHASNWYVNLWADNASYCAEIGLRLPDGRFSPIVRSNFVTTPRAKPSERSEQIWMEAKPAPGQAPFVIGEIHKTHNDRIAAEKRAQDKKANEAKHKKQRKIFLTEDDIRAYYSRLSPLLKDIIAERLAAKSQDKKRFGIDRVSVYLKDGRIRLDNILFRGISKDKFIRRLLAGASEELVELGGASESISSGGAASEQNLPEYRRRKFFFEIGTELIVYGRTEPDAEVMLGDKKVTLRRDGTFTLRFALPDGNIPLDFVATSNDKVDRREISTAVERRKTKYNP